jgi:hypothetical protein
MELYDITVRNELSGELETLSLTAACAQDAPVEALVQVFRLRGWRKARAFPPSGDPGLASHER